MGQGSIREHGLGARRHIGIARQLAAGVCVIRRRAGRRGFFLGRAGGAGGAAARRPGPAGVSIILGSQSADVLSLGPGAYPSVQ